MKVFQTKYSHGLPQLAETRTKNRFTASSSLSPLFLLWLVVTPLLLVSQGCALQPPKRSPSAESHLPPFVPPTTAPFHLSSDPLPQSNQPTPTLFPCTDSLTFIRDLTIPDGSIIQAGASIDKRWEVENSGTCNWEMGYTLRLIAGDELEAGTQQALTPARSGTRAVIRILFRAPTESGNYRSAWQAHNPQGQPFGDPIFIEIKVEP